MPGAVVAGPINSPHELSGLFDLALGDGPLALAVSGGADSMALLHLVARWRSAAPSPRDVIVLTVDHGLRQASVSEAAFVADQASRHGFRHETLTWTGDKPKTGLQSAAREARYSLLAGALLSEARLRGAALPRALVTAHHADDQAETMMMRLARGSGLDGLRAMRSATMINDVRVLRPLLSVPKARLVATLEAAGATWFEDPSNADETYERVRWRSLMPQLAMYGVTTHSLTSTARRIERAVTALEAATGDLARHAGLDNHNGAYASFDLSRFLSAPDDLRIRLLQRLLHRFGGASPAARLSEVEDLVERIRPSEAGAVTAGGTIVRWSPDQDVVRVCREIGRVDQAPMALVCGQTGIWDRRFAVSVRAGDAAGVSQSGSIMVRALGVADYATLRGQLTAALPSEAAATLPAFTCEGSLIAVPYFSDQSEALGGPVNPSGHKVCVARPVG